MQGKVSSEEMHAFPLGVNKRHRKLFFLCGVYFIHERKISWASSSTMQQVSDCRYTYIYATRSLFRLYNLKELFLSFSTAAKGAAAYQICRQWKEDSSVYVCVAKRQVRKIKEYVANERKPLLGILACCIYI